MTVTDLKMEFFVPETSAGQRLDQFLAQVQAIQSRTKALFLIESARVFLNHKLAKASTRLQGGDHISVHLPPPRPTELVPLKMDLDITFEDEDLIVVNKPSGLVVHPAHGHEQDTLVNALLAHTTQLSLRFGEQRPGIVHRIDKETSGLLVVAKNDFAHEHLSSQFKNKTTHRIYEALVFGQLKKSHGTVKSSLARHEKDRKKFASLKPGHEELGKSAITHYKVLKSDSKLSLVQLKLETGRTHQIRVHMSDLQHPLVGDNLYGADRKWKTLSLTWQEKFKSFQRFFLHAKELGFEHPRTKTALIFQQEWPEDEKKILGDYFHAK